MLFKQDKIRSYEEVNYRISGMRMTREYEIISKGKVAEVSEYTIYYSGHEDERVLDRRVLCDNEMMIELLNACGIMRWDGFSGKHPFGVSDGEMFEFSALVNDGKTIRASGSENFPKYFPEFRKQINTILSESNSIM